MFNLTEKQKLEGIIGIAAGLMIVSYINGNLSLAVNFLSVIIVIGIIYRLTISKNESKLDFESKGSDLANES